MEAPLDDLSQLVRKVIKTARTISIGIVVVAAIILALEVIDVYTTLAAIHVGLGVAFLVLVIAGLVWLVGRPIVRFVRTPAALTPPKQPQKNEVWTIDDVSRRADYVGRYVRQMLRTRAAQVAEETIEQVDRECVRLKRDIEKRPDAEAAAALETLAHFERQRVEPLLAPLDAEADRLIRQQALAVGAVTAVSPYGVVDAFIVLWRNANLVARMANLYYGRPGVRGSLMILRDVSAATITALYVQPASSAAGGLIRKFTSRAAGVVAGPLLDGAANALFTLRIGYVAKARCRSFEAWAEATRLRAVREAFAVAGRVAGGIFTDLASAVGDTVSNVGDRVGNAGRDTLGALWGRLVGLRPEVGEEST